MKEEAVFELVKVDKKEWPSLLKDVSKKEALRIKQDAIDRAHQKAEEANKKKSAMKNERRRDCVKKQMDLSSKLREEIEKVKKDQKEAAQNNVIEWKEKETEDDKILLPLWKKMSKELHLEKVKMKPKVVIKEKKSLKVPPPRSFGKITADFTFRAFPTPCRESKLDEEDEWLKKQAAARRATGFVAEDLRPEENDPMWLLEKGLNFHNVGNYLGAISAFSHAIKNWDKIPDLYVARSHSHLAIGNFRRVLFDTSRALELCVPHVADNADMRFYSHFNRGKALMEIGKPKSAMYDLVEAYELKPYFAQLENLMDKAENMEEKQEELPATSYFDPSVLAQ